MTTFQFPSKPTAEDLAQIRGILQQNSDTIAALKSQVRDLTGERDKWKLQAMDADLEFMGLRNQITERGEQLAESGSSKETGNNEAEEICGRVYVDYPITCQKLPMHPEACDNVADLRQENVRLRDTVERLRYAIENFAGHEGFCKVVQGLPTEECDCGFAVVERQLAGMRGANVPKT